MNCFRHFYRLFGHNDAQREFNFSHFVAAVALVIGATAYIYYH